MIKILLRRSIARRIFLTLLLTCLFVWFAIYLLGLYFVNKPNSGNFDREMFSLADTVRTVVETNPDPAVMVMALSGVEASLASQARVLNIPNEFHNFHVRSADGKLVIKSAFAEDQHLGKLDQVGFFRARLGNKSFRVYGLWTADRRYRIELIQSETSRREAFNSVMFSNEGMLFPFLVGFLLLLIPMWVAVRWGLRPLRRLSGELALRPPGDLRPLDKRKIDAELDPIVNELNDSLVRLDDLLQRERAFLADAAHEIRTPLALIAAQADTLSFASERESREEAIGRLHAGINRCSRLVSQLLSLARLEASADRRLDQFDIADVIRESLATYSRDASARGIDLTYEGPDHQVAVMPRYALESVINNLVGNATRYVQVGGKILVNLAKLPNGNLQFRVSDNGPGISLQERDSLFERFRRGANVTATGSGLGLAIAAAAARQFEAQFEVGSGLDGQGVSFAVEWEPQG